MFAFMTSYSDFILLLPITFLSQMMDTLQMVHLYPLLFNGDLSFLTLGSSLYPVAWLCSCSHSVSSDDFLLIFSVSILALAFLIHTACGFVLDLVSFPSCA